METPQTSKKSNINKGISVDLSHNVLHTYLNTHRENEEIKEENESTHETLIKCYCRVNYDFSPENESELGCLAGEYLKIVGQSSEYAEWTKCENHYGKSGLVPTNFLDKTDVLAESFFNKPNNNTFTKRLSDPIQDLVRSDPILKSPVNKLRNQSFSHINASGHAYFDESQLKRKQDKALPVTTETKNTFRVTDTIKPAIPPKPKLANKQVPNTRSEPPSIANNSARPSEYIYYV